MAERTQISENQAEEIVGGAFNFYPTKDGSWKCYVDGVGKFNSTADGLNQYINIWKDNKEASLDELVELCKQAGVIW